MANFYDNLSAEDVFALDGLARLLLELRDSRAQLLARHAASDEADLLERIRTGTVAEHPAYEDYLGACAIEATREQIRLDLKNFMLEIG
ncbi:MAG: hypothetical protein HY941_05285 [Gammaproteobacteria bacterium]|nr:hypothetical protein [Gammaproteobacteria bacterium]